MSRPRQTERTETMSFPRVSGDEPAGLRIMNFPPVFSPRERG